MKEGVRPQDVIEETIRHWNDAIRPDILGDMKLHEAILVALKAAGYAVVPVKPTEEMMRQGAGRMPDYEPDWDSAKDVWQEMLTASQHQERG